MVAMRLEDFTGLVPRRSERLLPVNAAATAKNTKLLSGEVRGFRVPRQIKDLTDQYFTVRRAYRIPYVDYTYESDIWLAFDSRNVDIVRSPILNDLFDRYYWAGDGRPKYNTFQRIRDGFPEFYLGVPVPGTAPTVSPPSGTDSSRSYVYTFVSEYGEEGPPSPPSSVQAGAFGTWVLSGLETSVPDGAFRNIKTKKIYRTVPGNVSNLFFFVAEVLLSDTTYNDAAADDIVALNNTLESTSWVEPPEDLEGWVAMPNGFLVGWVGRRLLFSEPYRPHAWPVEYEIGVEFEIVSLAVFGNTLVIGTRSNPYVGQGVTPASFTVQKLDAITPCLSRRGMVTTEAGVYFPSINGLMMVNQSGVQLVTQDLLTREEWFSRYFPETLYAASYGLQYIAFSDESNAFIFNPTEPTARLVELDRFDDVLGIETDRYNGLVYLIYQDRVWEFDPQNSERVYWRWKSKKFHLPKPLNFGALKIKFETGDVDVTEDIEDYYGPYNKARFDAGSLDTLNGHALHGVENAGLVPGWTEPENRMPLGGGPLYPLNDLGLEQSGVRFIAYANDEKVFDKIIRNEQMVRLPAGFKKDIWQFEMISNTTVYSVSIAETGRELEKV
jgi:hypothetical protein